MNFLDRVLGRDASPASVPDAPRVQARIEFQGAIADYIAHTSAGVTPKNALRNAAVKRCVDIIANTLAALPVHVLKKTVDGGVAKASEHPLFDILLKQSNNWQTAFVFKRLMTQRCLIYGNAYALPIWSGRRIIELVPIDPRRVTVRQESDWSVKYEVAKAAGSVTYKSNELLHVMGPSDDGLVGTSLVETAGEVLGLARNMQKAAMSLFGRGVMAGGALTTDKELSPVALANLKASLEEQYSGPEASGAWMVLEQGLKAVPFNGTAKDAQVAELRAHQVEEVARLFGVPRPFLMVDDTSWGSGIEQLGIFFVQYGLAPHFVAWEQAIERVLLTPDERKSHYVKFNERALLRGSIKDQGEFFAKALGSGGQAPWFTQDEVRGLQDLAPRGGAADKLGTGAMYGGTQ